MFNFLYILDLIEKQIRVPNTDSSGNSKQDHLGLKLTVIPLNNFRFLLLKIMFDNSKTEIKPCANQLLSLS